MTEQEAIAEGFTHHGKMFSVSGFLKDHEGEAPTFAARYAIGDYWVEFCSYAVQFACMLGADWMFPIWVGKRIETQ